jgi:hypothetical protein
MYRHRLARTGAILGILLVGCGGAAADQVVAGSPTPAAATRSNDATATAGVTVPPTTSPQSSQPAVEPAPPAGGAALVVRPAVEPPSTVVIEPATITVKYEPHDDGTATATLVETGVTLPLNGGPAVFADLLDGVYTAQVQVVYPIQTTGDSGIGAQSIVQAHPISVVAGDHAVVACDDSICTGIS